MIFFSSLFLFFSSCWYDHHFIGVNVMNVLLLFFLLWKCVKIQKLMAIPKLCVIYDFLNIFHVFPLLHIFLYPLHIYTYKKQEVTHCFKCALNSLLKTTEEINAISVSPTLLMANGWNVFFVCVGVLISRKFDATVDSRLCWIKKWNYF